jgi:alkylation response protein AidB-like acyl-CoA dehydrogenase
MPELANGERCSGQAVLTEDLLARTAARLARYGSDEDFAELQRAGYLKIAVPREHGGLGFSLPEVAREQRRLASRAPAAALAVNMHLCWTGAAADLYRSGDESLSWLLKEAGAGGVLAAGHDAPGHEPAHGSLAVRAVPAGGGRFRLYGRKVVGRPSPGWARLGVTALDASDRGQPKIVHAFIKRDAPGCRIAGVRDPFSARADGLVLDGAVVEPGSVARVLPVGPPPLDAFASSILAWTLPLSANICCGIGQRAFGLALEAAREHTARDPGGREGRRLPFTQWTLAEAALELGAVEAQLDRITSAWTVGASHCGKWVPQLFAGRHSAAAGAKRCLDLALQITEGDARSEARELGRLHRAVCADPGSGLR